MRRMGRASSVALWLSLSAGVAFAAPAPTIDLAAAARDLAADDPAAARAAAQRLGETRQAGARDILVDALAGGLHPEVAAVAVAALAKTPNGPAARVLAVYAHHRQPAVRAAALPGVAAAPDGKRVVLAALGDGAAEVRAVAARLCAERRWHEARPALLTLLRKGDAAAPQALGALADGPTALEIVGLGRAVKDELYADTLAALLANPRLGKEETYVQIVDTLAVLPGDEAIAALASYLGAQPETSTRPSVQAARAAYEQRVGGAK